MPAEDPKPPRRAPYLSQVLAGAYRDEAERQLLQKITSAPVPRHLAIIMDGNRRFAAGHGLLIREGHEQGREKLEELLNWCLEVKLRILTVYALSTENLGRPPSELTTLMDQFERGFRDIATDARVHRHHIRVRAIGNREALPVKVQEAIAIAESATADYDSYFYNVAIAYGGREEILTAVRALAREVKEGRLEPDQIDQQMVASRLYTANLPDPDLIFRTSGEERISNFLLWQAAYAELYFADVMWPGLTKLDFLRAIRAFQERQRRYGG
ncbi:MAG: polyprenyl diphosphate synthase [Thermoplasmata archaeon]|nr:polyprenyl diphosphate synthase [Thermoplasmata archaeon]